MLLSTAADKRFAFANFKLDLELSRTLEHLNIEHKEQMLIIGYDKRQFEKRLEILNEKKRQIQRDKRQTLTRSHSTTGILSRPNIRPSIYENSSGIGSNSRTVISQGISSTPSRWANRALSAPAVFPNGTCFTNEIKFVGSRFSMKANSANKQVAAKPRYQARPVTHPVASTRRYINASRKTLGTSCTKTVKTDIPTRYMGSKRRTSVPVIDGYNLEVKSDLSVETD